MNHYLLNQLEEKEPGIEEDVKNPIIIHNQWIYDPWSPLQIEGEGDQGSLYEVTHVGNGLKYVMKTIRLSPNLIDRDNQR